GYSRAELIGTPFPEYFTDTKRAAAGVRLTLDKGAVTNYQLTLHSKDGAEALVSFNAAIFKDESGAVRGIFASARDITEAARLQEQLAEERAYNRGLIEASVDGLVIVDESMRITDVNETMCRMAGRSRNQLISSSFPTYFMEQERAAEGVRLTLKEGSVTNYVLTLQAADDKAVPVSLNAAVFKDATNKVRGIFASARDITDQKQLESQLQASQFYTRSLIESNIDALMTTDPLGIITDVNKQMEALTGCTRDELIGAPFKNYFTDPERAEAGIALMLSGTKVTDYELTARARDGKETEVSYNATTFYDRDRKLQGVVAAARDVTERKRFERALQETNVELKGAKSAADQANLAKSDFLSSMSHELRSPLNAILGFAQLMESAVPAPTPAQAARITQILQAGWHLLNLINEILDLAVIESVQVSLSQEAVSLGEVMAECHSMMEPQAQARGIRMTFPKFDDPVFVRADMTRLKQIVINLLSNAIKYNRTDGTVVVACTLSPPQRVRISVRDTGEGLSPEKLAQLFQPFNRLGQETSGVTGTGIGLVVTKRLAELMGGVIGVESTPGEGSMFWCELTAEATPQLAHESGGSAAPMRPELPAGAPPRTLLYVEDNPANMELVAQLIARCPDLRLLTAVNAPLGIELARSARPAVILMDLNLPGISGIKALEILRAGAATAQIPVIALSANAMPRDIAKGLEAGFFRYLTKPIRVKDFMTTLDAALAFAGTTAVRRA
ncbi:MAG: PAS domain S-box protein, partial [Verrucomicrobia bacterium]|nr:PAS domain S-box protein [Verrucomicrobiota bacterium]